jgi:hypothetical protein
MIAPPTTHMHTSNPGNANISRITANAFGQPQAALKSIKDENRLICEALAACLNGLNQLGANGPVTKAREKLENYLNMEAYK